MTILSNGLRVTKRRSTYNPENTRADQFLRRTQTKLNDFLAQGARTTDQVFEHLRASVAEHFQVTLPPVTMQFIPSAGKEENAEGMCLPNEAGAGFIVVVSESIFLNSQKHPLIVPFIVHELTSLSFSTYQNLTLSDPSRANALDKTFLPFFEGLNAYWAQRPFPTALAFSLEKGIIQLLTDKNHSAPTLLADGQRLLSNRHMLGCLTLSRVEQAFGPETVYRYSKRFPGLKTDPQQIQTLAAVENLPILAAMHQDYTLASTLLGLPALPFELFANVDLRPNKLS